MRLIDADALKAIMIETLERIGKNPKMDGQERHIIAGIATLGEMIDDAPTVDAVPVVRCIDCRWWDAYPSSTAAPLYHECKRSAQGRLHTTQDEFCSRGEHRDQKEWKPIF